MNSRVLTGAGLFTLGAGAAAAVIFMSGAGAPPNSVLAAAEARANALRQQLEQAESAASDAMAVLEFWEREAGDQDSNLARLSTYVPGDAVGPILFDRAKQLAFRSAVSMQDAKLRAHTTRQKVDQIKTALLTPP
jgi:hypothetical protein